MLLVGDMGFRTKPPSVLIWARGPAANRAYGSQVPEYRADWRQEAPIRVLAAWVSEPCVSVLTNRTASARLGISAGLDHRRWVGLIGRCSGATPDPVSVGAHRVQV